MPNSVVPKIKDGIITSVLRELRGPTANPQWGKATFLRIDIHDPVIGAYLKQIEEKYGPKCFVSAMLVYRIIESQIEANQMDEDFV